MGWKNFNTRKMIYKYYHKALHQGSSPFQLYNQPTDGLALKIKFFNITLLSGHNTKICFHDWSFKSL